MSRQTTYRIWLKLVILHEYFEAEQCGLTLEPDGATKNLLQKNSMLFKQHNSRTWFIIGEENILPEEACQLNFHLKTSQSEFYYYTGESDSSGADWSFTDYNREGIWKILAIPVTEERLKASEPETIEIRLKSQLKHLEFLVFPPQSYSMGPLEIREQREKVLFKEAEEVNLPGTEKKLYRFVSTQTLPLKQKSGYEFHLWELRKSGENLLSKLPDFPRVNVLSPFSPKDTITSYIYL
jgi:hypothetical protein